MLAGPNVLIRMFLIYKQGNMRVQRVHPTKYRSSLEQVWLFLPSTMSFKLMYL